MDGPSAELLPQCLPPRALLAGWLTLASSHTWEEPGPGSQPTAVPLMGAHGNSAGVRWGPDVSAL